MKILWIGKYASDEIFKEMALKGYQDPAAQVSQSNIIEAFDELEIPLDTINAYNVSGSYPDKYIKSRVWTRNGNSSDISIGYTNIKYISHLFQTNNLRKAAKKWASKNRASDQIIVLVYGMQSSLLSAAIKVKRTLPNVKLYLIVPDLPQYMDFSMSTLKKILKKLDWIKIQYQMKYIKGYILYTSHMADFLHLPQNKWVLMEGSVNVKEDSLGEFSITADSNKIIVMYSGKIDKTFGIMELLDAIEKIKNDNYEFWFTGMGNAVNEVEMKSKLDPRIKYFGFLPSRNELLKLQKQATMLVNMRLPSENGSAYCFPSKIFEYMISGKPVLSFRITGIPDEYYKYLIEMKSTSSFDIAEAIKIIGDLRDEERYTIGCNAREFIINQKNALVQAKKIYDFIKE